MSGIASEHKHKHTNKVISGNTNPDGFREETFTKSHVETSFLQCTVSIFSKKETHIYLKHTHKLKTNTLFIQGGWVNKVFHQSVFRTIRPTLSGKKHFIFNCFRQKF